jgi:hypothetical protein
MSKQQEHIELIEAYLAGELQGEKLQSFEDQLSNDTELAQEVALHQELQAALADQETIDLENSLLEIRQELDEETEKATVVPLRSSSRWLIAASILVLIAAAAYLLWPGQEQNLYADFFEPYPNYLTTRTDNQNTTLGAAINAYQNQDYTTALGHFQELLAEDDERTDIRFYMGICQSELDQAEAALSSFEEVITQSDNTYAGPAKWYKALTHLKINQPEQAKSLLNQIISSNGDFSTEARDLLNEIDE